MTESHHVLIVGCGISGACAARLLAEKGYSVTIIDRRDHIGGNCHDHWDRNGICIHDYGAHIFHTDNQAVWDFLSRFTRWYPYQHKVRGLIDGQMVPIPFNLNSIHQIFPETIAKTLEIKLLNTYGYNVKVPILKLRETNDDDLSYLAEYIYQNIFAGYTRKQWGLNPEELDPAVTGRVPVYISRDDRYFQNRYQGIPLKGYTRLFKNILEHPNITIKLGVAFEDIRPLINKVDINGKIASDSIKADHILYSGAIDEYYRYDLGELPYRSEKFDLVELDTEQFQPTAVVNYPNNYTFTRIIEYKHFLGTHSSETIVAYEYPEIFEHGKNERYYPINTPANHTLYEQYRVLAEKDRKIAESDRTKTYIPVHFFGRLGDYQYYDMDKAIERAMAIVKEITA